MSERDIFEQMGASAPSSDTGPNSNYPPPQHHQDERVTGAHSQQPPATPPFNHAPPPHSPAPADAGAPAGGHPDSGEHTDKAVAGQTPDSSSLPAGGERFDDLTQEISPQQLREAREYAAHHRPPPTLPPAPQPGVPQWRAAPAGIARLDQPFGQQASYPGGPRDGGSGFISAAGSGELLGEQVRATDLVAVKKIPSSRGWRKWLYRLSFGTINTGESPDEQRVRAMRDQIAAPMGGTLRIAVIGGKGGAGKTSAAVAIGSHIAALRRHEHVIAIDADPGQGANLAVRIDRSAASSYAEIIAARNVVRYSDMRARVGHNTAGLDVLASPSHRGATAQSGNVTAEAYQHALRRLENFYNVVVTDCGVDIRHPVMDSVLGSANAVVMVTSAVPDGAEGAAKQIDWLSHHPRYRALLDRMVLVINHVRPATGGRDRKNTASLVEIIEERFGRWIPPERIFVVPYDEHIATAGVLELDELDPVTRRRFLEVTAAIAAGFTAVAEAS
ncbi:MinD/ParA family protein [Mycolicibacterium wolinskyi]|uniref:MinD/ParA family ATP-binding protein n=1 Tax=Mycolicibacterium wolinskyi TaxID=59750 RepID=UPI00082ED360|nr:MinD/ParA family protein [Mycolicibacterium wolinskyi]